MRILGLSSYPTDAAATRFRMTQYVEPLRQHGIELTIEPFLTSEQFRQLYAKGASAGKVLGILASLIRRLKGLRQSRRYDVLFVQREAMFFGPGIFEWLYRVIGGLPMVLDLDDATYISYVSPTYGRIGSALKFVHKTDKLIGASTLVTCGNRIIAEYAEALGARTKIIPTIVDTDQFKPKLKRSAKPVIGWIGTHSTFRVLEDFFPVIEHLAGKHQFVLKIIGSGKAEIKIPGVDLVNGPWTLEHEVSDFQSLDIGLYPIKVTSSMPADWILAKSGFKAIQYLAVGIPFVMSPVGICAEIGEPGVTHFNATNHDEWFAALEKLLMNPILRLRMGAAGREHCLREYQLSDQAQKLATVLFRAAGNELIELVGDERRPKINDSGKF